MDGCQVHVCALLGKVLQNGNISREFRSRLERYVEVLRRDAGSSRLYVAICGGRGEAEAAMRFLEQGDGDLLPPYERRFEDPLSENSIQNFDALGRYLVSLLSPDRQRIGLTVVSSKYHIDRILFVDRHLKPQSLVNSVRLAVHPNLLFWERVEYEPLYSDDAVVKWFAEVYTSVERLVPMQVNIEGMLDCRVNRMVEAVFSEFREGVTAIQELVNSSSCPSGTCNRMEVERVRDAVGELSDLLPGLAGMADEIGGSGRALSRFLAVLRPAIRNLREASDLDQDRFDGFFA